MEPNGQRDGHDGRKAFRHRRDRQGDAGLEHHEPGFPVPHPQDRHEGCRPERHPCEATSERVEPPLERRRHRRDSSRQRRNPAHFGRTAGTGDDSARRSGGDPRALVDHGLAVGEVGIGLELGAGRFADR